MRFGPVVTDEHPSHHTSRSVVFFEPEATSSLLMVQCSKHVIPPVVQGRPHRLPGARSRRRAQHSAQNSADLPATRQPVSPAHRLRWSTPISVDPMPEEDLSNPAERWTTMADDLSPRRAEMRRLADAGRLVIERMATTDAPPEAIERAAELLEAAAHE